jgi:hypothetical protein
MTVRKTQPFGGTKPNFFFDTDVSILRNEKRAIQITTSKASENFNVFINIDFELRLKDARPRQFP